MTKPQQRSLTPIPIRAWGVQARLRGWGRGQVRAGTLSGKGSGTRPVLCCHMGMQAQRYQTFWLFKKVLEIQTLCEISSFLHVGIYFTFFQRPSTGQIKHIWGLDLACVPSVCKLCIKVQLKQITRMCKTDPPWSPPPPMRNEVGGCQGWWHRWAEAQGWGKASGMCCPNYKVF